MKKLAFFTAFLCLCLPFLAVGCGSEGGESSTSYSGGYSDYYYYTETSPDSTGGTDGTNPSVITTSEIVVPIGMYSDAYVSAAGSGFGTNKGTVSIASKDGKSLPDCSVQAWNNDAVSIKLSNLGSASAGIYTLSLTTAAGKTVAGPDLKLVSASDPVYGVNTTERDLYSIFIGVKGDSTLGDICVADANKFCSALITGNNHTIRTQLKKIDGTTVGSNLEASMQEAAGGSFDTMNSNGIFLFYYSGHGNYNYIALNSNGITSSDLSSILAKMPETVTKIIILDSCSSGSFLPKDFDRALAGDIRNISSSVKNVIVLAACGPAQDSTAYSESGSEFTNMLVNGLSGSITESKITTGMLFNYAVSQTYTEQNDGTSTIPLYSNKGRDTMIK